MRPVQARRIPLFALVALVALLASGAVWGVTWWSEQHAADRSIVYVIPAGTAARQAAGETVSIFPETITIKRAEQDTLVIRNDDTQSVQIGPYKIDPGQRFSQRFYNRGIYEFTCSLHTSQQLRIVVE